MTVPVTSPTVQAIAEAITAAMVELPDDVKVLDAADPMQGYAQKSVTVGGTWDPESESFVTDQTVFTTVTESGAARQSTETTLVQCVAYSGSGDDDLPGHRTVVGRVLAAIRAELRAVHVIDDRSARVQVVEESWAQGGDGKGTLVMAMFTVQAVRLL